VLNVTSTTDKKLTYYDPSRILSYNTPWAFVTGARGRGKTYAFKKRVIKKAIEHGDEFIYLRRFKGEAATFKTFFDDVRWEFPGVVLSVKGKIAYIGSGKGAQPIGQVVYLSAAQMLKSVSLKKVKHIIFDEFILEKGATHYLPDEASIFEGLYSTVDRWDDRVRVYFLANAFSLTNPYYVKYGIVPSDEFIVEPGADRFWAVHTDRSEEFAQQVSKTRFGAFLRRQDDENSRYMIDSTFRDGGVEMVEAKPPSAIYSLSIVGGSRPLSLWLGRDLAVWYVTEGLPRNPNRFTLMPSNVDEVTRLLTPRDSYLKNIRAAYASGRVRFDKLTTRNLFIKEVYKGL
jgi:hypothetical protein